jgi:hypothetical protein
MSKFKASFEIIPYQWMDVAKPSAGIWIARTVNEPMPETFEHLNQLCSLTDIIYGIPDRLVAAGVLEVRFYAAVQVEAVCDSECDVHTCEQCAAGGFDAETISQFVDDNPEFDHSDFEEREPWDKHSNCKEAK